MRDNIPRKQQTSHAAWVTTALRPSGRGGTFGYTRIKCEANRQRTGREGRMNGAAEGNREGAPGEAPSGHPPLCPSPQRADRRKILRKNARALAYMDFFL